MLRDLAKKAFLRALFLLPHNSVYEYHHVTDRPKVELSACKMNTQAFYDFVLSHGPYVSSGELLQRERFDSHAAITFDDGLEDLYTIAYPFLKQHGIPFTAFLLPEKIGKEGYITREQMLQMAADPLVTLASHGIEHERHGQMEEQRQRASIMDSRIKLEKMLDKPCKYFAYPFGSYNKATLKIVESAGYERAFAVKGRPLFPWNVKAAYTVPRLSIHDGTVDYYRTS